MNAFIDRKTRDRIASALALAETESNAPDGERLAAIAAVERLLAKENLKLRDLACANVAAPRQMPEMGTWRETCRLCLQHRQALRAWEVNFLSDLPKFQRVSTKQRWALDEIAMRIGVKPRRSA